MSCENHCKEIDTHPKKFYQNLEKEMEEKF